MKTKLPIHLNARVAREKGSSSKKLRIHVDIFVDIPNVKVKDFKKEDLQNYTTSNPEGEKIGILALTLILITNDNVQIPNNTSTHVHVYLELETDKNASFKFDQDENNLFLVEVISDLRPEGTKRTVITYEDTDIIDAF